ncbi:MAG TPA: PaaI family thioesterase [Nocardioidaceae bacterium]|nr:PaaI family thioesterase [Nocardioidaceae bacterium]
MDLTTEQLHELMPYAGTLGIELTEATPDQVVGTMTWQERLTTSGGILHGGALMSLADSIGALCAFLNLPDGARTATSSSNTVFLRAARDGLVTATARPLHVGRSTIAVETQVTDGQGRPLVRTTQSQAVLT